MKEMEYKNSEEFIVLHEGEYDGFCFLIVSLGSHPCGYVKIPKKHPYYRVPYHEIDIWCHGGLSYSGDLNEIDDGHYIGWDYAHSGDYLGYFINYPELQAHGAKKTYNARNFN